jgi:hypothetical protein
MEDLLRSKGLYQITLGKEQEPTDDDTYEKWINRNNIKPNVIHFCVFGNVAWAHIPDEKMKALQPKSEKCMFVGYSKYVKGYKLLQPHCNEIIIRRYVKFDKNILAYEPNLVFVPSSACKPSSTFVPSSIHILASSTAGDDNEDENPPLSTHLPSDDSIETEPALAPSLLRWVHSTREAASDIFGDPSYQRQARL